MSSTTLSMPREYHFGVWLRDRPVGTLAQRGDHTRFFLNTEYLTDPERPVLGLVFEQDLRARQSAALRLPPWFSNLLPEGRLRDWIAAERGVSAQREMELLAQTGHDLPGAVRVRPIEAPEDVYEHWEEPSATPTTSKSTDSPWRFSLAGVALKFSMLAVQDRLTLPATGQGGDWIVKLPDRLHPDVPRNEFAMMTLADNAGIEVPELPARASGRGRRPPTGGLAGRRGLGLRHQALRPHLRSRSSTHRGPCAGPQQVRR